MGLKVTVEGAEVLEDEGAALVVGADSASAGEGDGGGGAGAQVGGHHVRGLV